MGLVTRLRTRVDQWRAADTFHYECTVCEWSFQTDHGVCPDCGGDVERVAGVFDATAVDPHP